MRKKTIKLMDYAGTKKSIVIDNFEDVVRLTIEVVSGDEILHVLYNNYDIKEYDSSNDRMMDFADDEYCIYDTTKDINLISKWAKRKSSYDRYNRYMLID
jgi:hypothetical protein